MQKLSDQTMSMLDAVLDATCRCLPNGGDHDLRRTIAEQLLKSAMEGNTTVDGLEGVARAALAEAMTKST
jgi:hypothetical protein